MIYAIVVAVFVLACAALTLLILLQSSKDGGLSSAFGGSGASQTLFGSARGTFLTKATTVVGTVFLVLAILLNLVPSCQSTITTSKTSTQK